MTGIFNRNVGDIKRNYFAGINLFRIVTWWAFIVVLFFGYFGIRPLYKILGEKNRTLKEMGEINKNLGLNINNMVIERERIQSTGQNLSYLYTFMPRTPDVQSYLVEMLPKVSEVGFAVKRYTPAFTSDEGQYPITVIFEGTGNPTELIKSLEELKRITRVESFKVSSKEDGNIQVDTNLIIYFFDSETPQGVLMDQ